MRKNPFSLLKDNGLDPPTYGVSPEDLQRSIGRAPCECADCQNGFYMQSEQRQPGLSYHRRLSDTEAEDIARSLARRAEDQRTSLVSRLSQFADVLMSRWKKRSQAKRKALLEEAAPGLEEGKWLLPRYSYTRERHFIEKRSRLQRKRLLLPWLSVEVLVTNPAILFALLHYRTAYAPASWAAFDSRQLTMGWAVGFFDVDFSVKCIVMHGADYGSLVKWEERAAHRGDIVGFPRAALVLEAQAHLMEVLHSIVDKILEGVDASQPPRSDKWVAMVGKGAFQETGVLESWSYYTNQAFSPPPRLDSAQLVSLARSRMDATGDHLRFLQSDAAYLRRYIKILFAATHFAAATDEDKGGLLAQHLQQEVVNHHWWCWVEAECRHVDTVRRGLDVEPQPGRALPARYDRALGSLELLLVNRVRYTITVLKTLLPHVPGLQEHWAFKPIDGIPAGIAGKVHRNGKANSLEALNKDPLDWCLVQMLGLPDDQTSFDHELLFGMLYEQLSSKASERSRLDETMYQVLSDLASYHELLVSIRLQRPQNAARTVTEVRASEDRRAWWKLESREARSRTGHWTRHRRVGSLLVQGFYRAAAPSGRRDAAWLRKVEEQRAIVESFWTSIRAMVREGFQDSEFRAEEVEELLGVVSVHLGTAYQREAEAEAEAVRGTAFSKPTDTVVLFPGGDDTRSYQATTARRGKIKTKGNATELTSSTLPSTGVDAQEEVSSEMDGANLIRVAKTSLEVFLLMFPEREEGSFKDIQWERFVHAMMDAGFSARSNGGSAVSFFRAGEAGGRIVFHKPHPSPKIDSVLLRIIGKRMKMWFGWERRLFRVREE